MYRLRGIIQKYISPLSGFVQTSMDGKRQAADNSVGGLFVAFWKAPDMGDELWMQVASVFIPLFGYILVIMIIGTLIDYISSLFGFSRNWGINLISYNMWCHSGFAYKQEQSKSLKEIRNLKVIFSDTVIITVLFSWLVLEYYFLLYFLSLLKR